MRIGIVGSAGSGKSTLARDLAAALRVPLIEDMTLELLRAQKGVPSWRGIRDIRVRRTIRLRALEEKVEAENAAPAFVSDKTVVDYLAYWLQNQAEYETAEQTQAFFERAKDHLSRYDLCVFLPVREEVDYAEGRSNDPIHNLKVGAFKRGLLSMLGVPVVDAPYTFGEDMSTWIKRWLPSAAGSKKASKAKKTSKTKKAAKSKTAAKSKKTKKKTRKAPKRKTRSKA